MGASSYWLIYEIRVVADNGWRLKLIRTIQQAYRSAPHFQQVFPLLSEIISFPERNLARYLLHGLSKISTYLEIKADLIPTSSVFNNEKTRRPGSDP